MNIILNYLREHHPNILIEFSAQAYSVPFYQKLGFAVDGEEHNEGGILHRKMRSVES
jgi:predicted GNAT family N-acyltransferase